MSDINPESVLKPFVENDFFAWPLFSINGVFVNIGQETPRAEELNYVIRGLEDGKMIERGMEPPYGLGWRITEKGKAEYQRLFQKSMREAELEGKEYEKKEAEHTTSLFQATTGIKLQRRSYNLAFGAFIVSTVAAAIAIVAIVVTHNDAKPQPVPYDTAAHQQIRQLEQRFQAIEESKVADTVAPVPKTQIRPSSK